MIHLGGLCQAPVARGRHVFVGPGDPVRRIFDVRCRFVIPLHSEIVVRKKKKIIFFFVFFLLRFSSRTHLKHAMDDMIRTTRTAKPTPAALATKKEEKKKENIFSYASLTSKTKTERESRHIFNVFYSHGLFIFLYT